MKWSGVILVYPLSNYIVGVIHVLVLYPITVVMKVVGETLSLSLHSCPPMEALNHCSENQLLWLAVYGHSLMVMCVLHKKYTNIHPPHRA